MSAFEDIKLEWDGKVYVIRSGNVMRAIARVEDVVTLQELSAFAKRGTAPAAKIALAYASVLEFAGCPASATDVYERMFQEASQDTIASSVQGLLFMMLPPNMKKLAMGNPQPEKKAAKSPASRSAASKKRSKRQSPKVVGALLASSGNSPLVSSGG